jgi:hypothetical protein
MGIQQFDATYDSAMDSNYVDPGSYYGGGQTGYSSSPASDLFSRHNDLKVIQEYNNEEFMPNGLKTSMWALASKSIKLGFWDKEDLPEIFLYKNIIKIGDVMSKPKHRYSFADRQQVNQMDFLVYADFKRGVGMEKYKINERTLQATSVTQNIQGGSSGGKRGGFFSGVKSFFG